MLPDPMATSLSSLETNAVSEPGSHCFPLEALRIQGSEYPLDKSTCTGATNPTYFLSCPTQPTLMHWRTGDPPRCLPIQLLWIPLPQCLIGTLSSPLLLLLPRSWPYLMSGLLPNLLIFLPIFCLCLYFILHNTAQGSFIKCKS